VPRLQQRRQNGEAGGGARPQHATTAAHDQRHCRYRRQLQQDDVTEYRVRQDRTDRRDRRRDTGGLGQDAGDDDQPGRQRNGVEGQAGPDQAK